MHAAFGVAQGIYTHTFTFAPACRQAGRLDFLTKFFDAKNRTEDFLRIP